MSTTPLPRQADLRRLCAATASISGFIELSDLPRLASLLVDPRGRAGVQLRIGQDDEGYRFVEGAVCASLHMQCQRCLGEVAVEVDTPVRLAMVWGEEEIASLPSRFEGLIVGTAPYDLFELVEEELLLSAPLVPRHGDGACRIAPHGEAAGEVVVGAFAAALRPDHGR